MKTRWIIVSLTVLFIWALVSHFTQLQELTNTLQQGQLSLIFAALVSQAAYFIVFTASYQAAFFTLDIQTRTRDLIPVTLGSLFVNMVVPAGIAGGTALFAQELAKEGKSATRTTTGILLQLTADYAAFVLILIPGLVYLNFEHDLKPYEIIAAIILLLMTVGLSGILLLGVWKPGWLNRTFVWLQDVVTAFYKQIRRDPPFGENWAQENADEFNRASLAVASHPSRLIRTVVVALLAHLLNITTLYILFRAFNQSIELGTLVAGYAVGILFWIVSITPQGIGIVEGVMALTFSSLEISGAVATTVVLAFRGLTFWIPMLLGFFAVQRAQLFNSTQRTLTEVWGVRFAAILVGMMGIINVISAVTPSLPERFAIIEQLSPLEVQSGGRLTAALSGFALLLLARNLARRKRVAWLLALATLFVSISSHLVKGLDYEEATLAAGLMIMLWFMRTHFHADSDRPSIRQGLRVLAMASIFTLTYGVSGFFLLDHHYSVNFGFWAAIRQTLVMFTQFYDPGLTPVTQFGRFFASSIYIIGAVTMGYAIVMMLRPVFVHNLATQEERMQALTIIEKFGHSSLARFLLMDDKRYHFSPGGSIIGYALAGRTAIALGDPIGPSEDRLPSINDFISTCRRNDWIPAFYQTQPETLDLYKAAGFNAICVGHEGIVDLQTFSLEGKAGKALRAPVNKIRNAGYRFIVHAPPISDEMLEQLRAISDEWLTTMHGSEKRFSLGWFEDGYIQNSPIAAVHAPEGWITAFATLVPEYQRNELSVDLMRRRANIENGIMEFLFVCMFEWAKEHGYNSFNLGLSALSGVGEKPGDPSIEKVMHFIYENINQFYNFKGLHNFKEKFHPNWSPRYLIYQSNSYLTQTWLGVIQASSGENNQFIRYLRHKLETTTN